MKTIRETFAPNLTLVSSNHNRNRASWWKRKWLCAIQSKCLSAARAFYFICHTFYALGWKDIVEDLSSKNVCNGETRAGRGSQSSENQI